MILQLGRFHYRCRVISQKYFDNRISNFFRTRGQKKNQEIVGFALKFEFIKLSRK